MPFHSLDLMAASKSPVPVHDEGDVLGNRALTQSTDEEFAELVDGPFDGRRLEEPFSDLGKVH